MRTDYHIQENISLEQEKKPGNAQLVTMYLYKFSMKWNMALMYLFELILLLCTQSFRASACLGHLAMTWCISIFFLAYGAQTGFRWKIQKKSVKAAIRLASLGAGAALAAFAKHRLLYTDMLVKAGFLNTHGFDQNMNYHFNGYLVASCMDIQDSRIKKPQGYSLQRVSELLEEATGDSEGNHYNWSGDGSGLPEYRMLDKKAAFPYN